MSVQVKFGRQISASCYQSYIIFLKRKRKRKTRRYFMDFAHYRIFDLVFLPLAL